MNYVHYYVVDIPRRVKCNTAQHNLPLFCGLFIFSTQNVWGQRSELLFWLHNFSSSDSTARCGRRGLPIHATTVTLMLVKT